MASRNLKQYEAQAKCLLHFGVCSNPGDGFIDYLIKQNISFWISDETRVIVINYPNFDKNNIDHIVREARKGKYCAIYKYFELHYINEMPENIECKLEALTRYGFVIKRVKHEISSP